MPRLVASDPEAVALTAAIRTGDVDALQALLTASSTLATARLVGSDGVARSLLHVATDWPGHFPNVARTIAILAAAGADVNARMAPHPRDANCQESPLHWAASSNDVEAIDALLDAGADIEIAGAIFTGGTPLSDAVVFANWDAARRLLARGAVATWWQAAALGMPDVVRARLEADPPPSADEITRAFWHACRAAQRSTAEVLLDAGADADWVGWDRKTPRQVAVESGEAAFSDWLQRRARRS